MYSKYSKPILAQTIIEWMWDQPACTEEELVKKIMREFGISEKAANLLTIFGPGEDE